MEKTFKTVTKSVVSLKSFEMYKWELKEEVNKLRPKSAGYCDSLEILSNYKMRFWKEMKNSSSEPFLCLWWPELCRRVRISVGILLSLSRDQRCFQGATAAESV